MQYINIYGAATARRVFYLILAVVYALDVFFFFWTGYYHVSFLSVLLSLQAAFERLMNYMYVYGIRECHSIEDTCVGRIGGGGDYLFLFNSKVNNMYGQNDRLIGFFFQCLDGLYQKLYMKYKLSNLFQY